MRHWGVEASKAPKLNLTPISLKFDPDDLMILKFDPDDL
jgi:hypothetical protein